MQYYQNPPYYLTAYGIALKHGFRGTEEEWLESLRGPKGDPVLWKAQYETEAELRRKHPDGKPGDCYLVGTDLYWWDDVAGGWKNAGSWQGPQGERGEPGPEGRQGVQGPQGERGEKGDRGDPGPRGCRGPIGPEGPAGPQGPKGDGLYMDDLTPEQIAAIKGPKGDTGEQGPRGEPGEQGPKGDTGPRGPKGDKGDTGEQGPPGKGFTIGGYYGTLEDLAGAVPSPGAGDSYSVGTQPPYDIYTWDAVRGQWVSNGSIQGPKGDNGQDGRGLASLTIDDRGQLHAAYTDGTEQALMARGVRYVVRRRLRELSKPPYGLEDQGFAIVLETGNLSGAAEISVLVSGREYDAENLSTDGAGAPDGTIIIKKMEE